MGLEKMMENRMKLFRCSMFLLLLVLGTFGALVLRNSLSWEVNILRRNMFAIPARTMKGDFGLLVNSSYGNNTRPKSGVSRNGLSFGSFSEALASRASYKKDIILALMDKATLPMAINFWETSLKPYNIENYLFISSSREACEELIANYSIPCYLYMEDKASSKTSVYNSKDFKRKMNIRTFMILEGLKLGYNILHTDVDELWFKNPLEDIQCSEKCDVAALWDCGAMNAGFVYVRSTPMGIAVYEHMEKTAKTTDADDQTAFNRALGAIKSKGLGLVRLPGEKYQCGVRYFEQGHRYFAGDNPCKTCVVAHNNWIVSIEAKTYRFKELHYWMYDGDGYYSDANRKYISYNNPFVTDMTNTSRYDADALRNALAIGDILNRTVILPKFHCGSESKMRLCSLLNHLKIRDLDTKFSSKYRESTFLTHPKVPQEVTKSKSEIFLIENNFATGRLKIGEACTDCKRLIPNDKNKGATAVEILAWFKNIKMSVLKFHSLYGAVSQQNLNPSFQSELTSAIKPGSYRQF